MVREGRVRCGRCQHAFPADKHLVRKPIKTLSKPTPSPVRKRAPAKKSSSDESQKITGGFTDTARAPPEPRAPIAPLVRPQRVHTRKIYWALGSAMLVLLLSAQALVFYGYELARDVPALRTSVDLLCEPLACRRLPLLDMRHMDLVETQVAPHPRYDKALRVKATLVNRAERVQPYPLLEVSLIDNQGQLVARRTYPPREYLSKPEAITLGMPPQLAVNVQLDITSPGTQASGYEVLLLPPPDSALH